MNIGVIGAGAMGAGIAWIFAAQPDNQVLLCDLRPELVRAALKRLRRQGEKLIARGQLNQKEIDQILARLHCGQAGECDQCDLIVEAVFEDLIIKKELLACLDEICAPDALLTTNTSSLPLAELARGLNHHLSGFHFFNPVQSMKLVEIIPLMSTPPASIQRLKAIAVSIGKTPVVVADSPGFLVNRMLVPMINEAVGLLAEGAASAEDIDAAMRLGANLPMGPLALGDLIGLDVCLAAMESLRRELGEDKYRPHPLLRKMVRHNFLGRKSGRGFYNYQKY